MDQGGGQRGVCTGIWRSAPKDAPTPQGAGFSGRRKDPFPDGSRDQAVPRHVQQKRAALLVHFPKLSFALASSAPGNSFSREEGFAVLAWKSKPRVLGQAFLMA